MLPTKYSGTSIQGTPPFRRHKIWSRKNVHIIFVSVTSIEGTAHLYSEKRDTFSGYPTFILHSGGTLALKKWLGKSLNFTMITMMPSETEKYQSNQCTAIFITFNMQMQYYRGKINVLYNYYTLSSCFAMSAADSQAEWRNIYII